MKKIDNSLKMKRMNIQRMMKLVFYLILGLFLIGCQPLETNLPETILNESVPSEIQVEESSSYTSKEEIALYIHTFEKLPNNFITKQQAMKLGWDNSKGNLWEVTDQKSIGGDVFGNFEGLLPKEKGRIYYEADIDYQGGYRNALRIVFSNDGLIFYTNDHYSSFERLY